MKGRMQCPQSQLPNTEAAPEALKRASAPLQTPSPKLALIRAGLEMHNPHFQMTEYEFAINNREGHIVQLKPVLSQFILDPSQYVQTVLRWSCKCQMKHSFTVQ